MVIRKTGAKIDPSRPQSLAKRRPQHSPKPSLRRGSPLSTATAQSSANLWTPLRAGLTKRVALEVDRLTINNMGPQGASALTYADTLYTHAALAHGMSLGLSHKLEQKHSFSTDSDPQSKVHDLWRKLNQKGKIIQMNAGHGIQFKAALASKSDLPGMAYVDSAGCYLGFGFVAAIEDMYIDLPKNQKDMLTKYVLVHEFGEMIFSGEDNPHHWATKLEFAMAEKDGKLEEYLELLGMHSLLKFRDVALNRKSDDHESDMKARRNADLKQALQTVPSDMIARARSYAENFDLSDSALDVINQYDSALSIDDFLYNSSDESRRKQELFISAYVTNDQTLRHFHTAADQLATHLTTYKQKDGSHSPKTLSTARAKFFGTLLDLGEAFADRHLKYEFIETEIKSKLHDELKQMYFGGLDDVSLLHTLAQIDIPTLIQIAGGLHAEMRQRYNPSMSVQDELNLLKEILNEIDTHLARVNHNKQPDQKLTWQQIALAWLNRKKHKEELQKLIQNELSDLDYREAHFQNNALSDIEIYFEYAKSYIHDIFIRAFLKSDSLTVDLMMDDALQDQINHIWSLLERYNRSGLTRCPVTVESLRESLGKNKSSSIKIYSTYIFKMANSTRPLNNRAHAFGIWLYDYQKNISQQDSNQILVNLAEIYTGDLRSHFEFVAAALSRYFSRLADSRLTHHSAELVESCHTALGLTEDQVNQFFLWEQMQAFRDTLSQIDDDNYYQVIKMAAEDNRDLSWPETLAQAKELSQNCPVQIAQAEQIKLIRDFSPETDITRLKETLQYFLSQHHDADPTESQKFWISLLFDIHSSWLYWATELKTDLDLATETLDLLMPLLKEKIRQAADSLSIPDGIQSEIGVMDQSSFTLQSLQSNLDPEDSDEFAQQINDIVIAISCLSGLEFELPSEALPARIVTSVGHPYLDLIAQRMTNIRIFISQLPYLSGGDKEDQRPQTSISRDGTKTVTIEPDPTLDFNNFDPRAKKLILKHAKPTQSSILNGETIKAESTPTKPNDTASVKTQYGMPTGVEFASQLSESGIDIPDSSSGVYGSDRADYFMPQYARLDRKSEDYQKLRDIREISVYGEKERTLRGYDHLLDMLKSKDEQNTLWVLGYLSFLGIPRFSDHNLEIPSLPHMKNYSHHLEFAQELTRVIEETDNPFIIQLAQALRLSFILKTKTDINKYSQAGFKAQETDLEKLLNQKPTAKSKMTTWINQLIGLCWLGDHDAYQALKDFMLQGSQDESDIVFTTLSASAKKPIQKQWNILQETIEHGVFGETWKQSDS